MQRPVVADDRPLLFLGRYDCLLTSVENAV